MIHWTEDGLARSARWRAERGIAPHKRVVVADETMTADAAYRLACEGTALLWRGDFQNARQMLLAMARRVDQKAQKAQKANTARKSTAASEPSTAEAFPSAFHMHRLARSQRARTLGMLLQAHPSVCGQLATQPAGERRERQPIRNRPPGQIFHHGCAADNSGHGILCLFDRERPAHHRSHRGFHHARPRLVRFPFDRVPGDLTPLAPGLSRNAPASAASDGIGAASPTPGPCPLPGTPAPSVPPPRVPDATPSADAQGRGQEVL